jgi:hypothetical protein
MRKSSIRDRVTPERQYLKSTLLLEVLQTFVGNLGMIDKEVLKLLKHLHFEKIA